jgi:hypothetical protein
MEREKGIWGKTLGLMKESVYHKKGGKVSSGRLSSFFILFAIIGAALTFIGIDIANACVAIYNKGFYEIPANHLVIYGMTLAHHLTLLGINKNAETQVERAVQDKLKSIKEMNSEDSAVDIGSEEDEG